MPTEQQLSYYKVLGVRPDATVEQIRAAYRHLAKAAHPDTGGADALFVLVKDAYDALIDPYARAAHDASLAHGGPAAYTRPTPQPDPQPTYTTQARPNPRPRPAPKPQPEPEPEHIWEQDDWADLDDWMQAAANSPTPSPLPLWRRAWPRMHWALRLLAIIYGAVSGLAVALFWHIQATYTAKMPIIAHEIGQDHTTWYPWFILAGAAIGPILLAVALRRRTPWAWVAVIGIPLWTTFGVIIFINIGIVFLFLVLLRAWDRHRGRPTMWFA